MRTSTSWSSLCESLPGSSTAKTSVTLPVAADRHDPNCLGSTVLVTGIVTTTGRNRPRHDEMQQTVRQRLPSPCGMASNRRYILRQRSACS